MQLAEKNRKESLVNEEKAKLRQIESKGNASITIAESEVNARISKIRAEAELYSSQVRAKGDKEVNVAAAEAKRLKADALDASRRALRRRARDREDVRQHRGRRHDARAVHRVHPQRVGRHRRQAPADRRRREARSERPGASPGVARGPRRRPRGRALGLRRDVLDRGRREDAARLVLREARRRRRSTSRAASTSSCPSSTRGRRSRSPSRTSS